MAGGHDEDRQPTPEELRTRLIHDAALQIASRLVNTSESLDVLLARGGPLDAPNKLMEQQLWTRALESLETMPPLGQPEDDAYRLYNLGVVNEALGYQAEDVVKARKYLQEAAVDYGKAIDAKPAEKNFLEPQTRIDSALAHYKRLGDLQVASAKAATATSAAAADALTNKDIIAMVQGKLDEANIIDTVQHSAAVNFDLTPKGQIDLSKASVNGHIIAAMKQRARQ
jgi:tetratricopeptide (TPR) repeat protein